MIVRQTQHIVEDTPYLEGFEICFASTFVNDNCEQIIAQNKPFKV